MEEKCVLDMSRRTNTDFRILLDSKGKLKVIMLITRLLEDESKFFYKQGSTKLILVSK